MKATVIGAGIWGASSAYYLQQAGVQVHLIDMWGAGNARAGSGGASRIIRLGYGSDEIYIDLTNRSYELWGDFFRRTGLHLYQETGCLWLFSQEDDSYIRQSIPRIMHHHGHIVEKLDRGEAHRRYPQINLEDVKHLYLERKAGILYADQCCKHLVEQFVQLGGHYQIAPAEVAEEKIHTDHFLTVEEEEIPADFYVFACGPWNRKLFPTLLAEYTYTSRQEVYYFAVPNQSVNHYSGNQLPVWLDYNAASPLYYGMPFHLNKGFKIAYDDRSDAFDPDTGERRPTPTHLQKARDYIAHRFPGLKGMPLVESRVCQYENSLDGHFFLDVHPENEKLIILGGSSGHGFKMGPGVGELVARYIVDGQELPGFFRLERLRGRQGRSSQFIK